MKKIVTFGEIMLRLTPSSFNRFVQADSFDATFGGAEANVAVSLANFGLESEFVTKIPENEIGQAAINSLRRYGVSTQNIVRGGPRLGIYFMEKGASQRPSKIIYDRSGSSIALSKPSDFDWDLIFQNATWFHITGISPALGGDMPQICLQACKKAKEKGLFVSCDLNFRSKLWSSSLAGEVMSELCKYVDLCTANEEDAEKVFGIKAEKSDVNSGIINNESYVQTAQKLAEKFSFKYVAITLRTSISASRNKWQGLLYNAENKSFELSKEYDVTIVDRVGAGDSFTAGLIYGLINHFSDKDAVEFAAAASCLKHSVEGDFNMVSLEEVQKLAAGDSSGRVQR